MHTQPFKALMLEQDGQDVRPQLRELTHNDLPEGEVLVQVHYSSLNYKDSMALANKGIIRKFPAIPGIDFSGVVVESSNPAYKAGDQVVLTGWGVGERFWGGYSQYARVKAEWLVPLPAGLSLLQAMQVGTAGFTAMMCVDALERHGIKPGTGPIVVTGASGGVGSVALPILAARGYEVWALTGNQNNAEALKALGASKVVAREEYAQASKPGRHTMEAETFAGVIDTVGGDVLSALIARVAYGGAVAACGLVGGTNIDTTVFPFIIRGVSLLGIDSVRCPSAKRQRIWQRVANDLPLDALARVSRIVGLEQVPDEAANMLAGKGHGRVVVGLQN